MGKNLIYKIVFSMLLSVFICGVAHSSEQTKLLHKKYNFYADQGNYSRAVEYAYKISKIIKQESGAESHYYAAALGLVALSEIKNGNFRTAEPIVKKAIEISIKKFGENNILSGELYSYLGGIKAYQGVTSDAIKYYKKAIAINVSLGGRLNPELISPLLSLATINDDLGNREDSEKLLRHVLQIAEANKNENRRLYGITLAKVGDYYLTNGRQLRKAETYLTIAHKILISMLPPNHKELVSLKVSMADLMRLKGYHKKEKEIIDKAYKIASENNNIESTTSALTLRICNLERQGDFKNVEKLLLKLLEIKKEKQSSNSMTLPKIMFKLSMVKYLNGKKAEAFQIAKTASLMNANNLINIGASFSDEVLADFIEVQSDIVDWLIWISYNDFNDKNKKIKAAYEAWVVRKGLRLEIQREFQAALYKVINKKDKKYLEKLLSAKRELSDLVYSNGEVDNLKVASLVKMIKDNETYLIKYKKHKSNNNSIKLEEIHRRMPADSALIDIAKVSFFKYVKEKKFFHKQHHYIAFVLTGHSNDNVKLIDLGEAEPVDHLIEKYLSSLERKKSSGPNAILRELYSYVIAPIKPDVHGVNRLIVSPDGMLCLVPFYIFMNESNEYLISNYIINYVFSARDLLNVSTCNDVVVGPAVLVGAPDFGTIRKGNIKSTSSNTGFGKKSEWLTLKRLAKENIWFSPLPQTKNEVMSISKIIHCKHSVLLGKNATYGALLKFNSPEILHIATHGFFLDDDFKKDINTSRGITLQLNKDKHSIGRKADDASTSKLNLLLQSGIALAGANYDLNSKNKGLSGIVTADKILSLNLIGTKLVVLSACDTAKGAVRNKDGIFGLTRAFYQVGSKNIIASLWKVPDLETRELMVNFYKNIQNKMPYDKALREAMIQEIGIVHTRYGSSDPFFWGAFVHINCVK